MCTAKDKRCVPRFKGDLSSVTCVFKCQHNQQLNYFVVSGSALVLIFVHRKRRTRSRDTNGSKHGFVRFVSWRRGQCAEQLKFGSNSLQFAHLRQVFHDIRLDPF